MLRKRKREITSRSRGVEKQKEIEMKREEVTGRSRGGEK